MKNVYGRGSIYHLIYDKPHCFFNPGDPSGITIHYTGDGSFVRCVEALKQKGLSYHFIIEKDGTIYQTMNLTWASQHAGKAMWLNSSPNRSHISIALVSWGLLSKEGKSWAGDYIGGVSRGGKLWDIATREQEKSLESLLVNLIDDYKIHPNNICGHDEAALPAGRKQDPGAILSKSVPVIRGILNADRRIIFEEKIVS